MQQIRNPKLLPKAVLAETKPKKNYNHIMISFHQLKSAASGQKNGQSDRKKTLKKRILRRRINIE